jgi:hypothetical protein
MTPCMLCSTTENKVTHEDGKHFVSMPTTPRALSDIAWEIRRTWKNVYFGAVPYLNAMFEMNSPRDNYGYDSGVSIVLRFLGNATTWRGADARRIKAELKSMVKGL